MVSGVDTPPLALITAMVSFGLMLLVFFARERRLAEMRRKIAGIHALSEQILIARTPAEIVEKLQSEPFPAAGCQRAVVFVYRAESNSLEPIARNEETRLGVLQLAAPEGPDTPLALRSFRSADPLTQNEPGPPPRGTQCFPMFAQADLTGVLQFEYDRALRGVSTDETVAMQHLANQTAIALKLMDQQLLREQILRGEKLGAAGELISGVAHELRAPLDLLGDRARRLIPRLEDPSLASELRALAEEAGSASAALERLVSFSRGDQNRARPFSLNRLITELLEFRGQQLRLKSITVVPSLAEEDLVVVGAQGQMQQAFLSLLLHAEHSVTMAPERRIAVTSRSRAGRAMVEIDYSAAPVDEPETGLGALSLAVCRGIFENHGGSMQHLPSPSRSVFSIDLPHAQAASLSPWTSAPRRLRTLTVLLAEPETVSQRHVLGLLAMRNHRVIASNSGTEALDFLQRVKFDLLVCSTHVPDMSWAELAERSRRYVAATLLLTEVSEHIAGVQGQPSLVKPVDEARLDEMLATIAGDASTSPE